MFAPTPGKTPIKVPIPEDLNKLPSCFCHARRGIHAESFPATFSTSPPFPVRSSRILPMANMPISTGINRNPSFIEVMPRVHLSSPVAGCIPGMATSTPRLPASKPRARVESPTPANRARARTTSEKSSKGPSLVDQSAMGSDNCQRATQETRPPKSEAPTPRPRARPGRPDIAMG